MHSRSSGPSAAPPEAGPDPLAAVIALLRPRMVFAKLISGAGQWSVRYAAHEDPGFAIVLEGSCFLDVAGAKPTAGKGSAIQLAAGDFVFLPSTPGFTMASDLALTPTPVLATDVEELRHGTKTGQPTMRMLGGYFRFERANAHLIPRFLPPIVHVRRSDKGAARLRRIVELISDEATDRRPGRELVLERLVEVLLVEALRFRPARAGESSREQGLLAGLADPALARALRKIHEDVARRWTVADLARSAGMSRAVFAERFTRTVGMPPMQYLLEWRIAIAKDVLQHERAPLAEIAERIGYQSASAFSTAFTRHAGCPPSSFARASAT